MGISTQNIETKVQASGRLSRSGWAWTIFEASRIPQFLLISSYVFMPYFVTKVVGNPVEGQRLVAFVHSWFGLAMAFTAPLLGSSIDRWGSRKALLGLLVGAQFCVLMSLWWVEPNGVLPMWAMVTALGLFTLVGGYTDVLYSSMLPHAVDRAETAKASGYALTIANAVGVIALVGVLWAFELPGKMLQGLVPDAPLFGLDRSRFEPSRIVGPISAVLLAVCSIPLFLFSRDGKRSTLSVGQSIKGGARDLARVVRHIRTTHRNIAMFLLARVAFIDALAGYVLFNGIYSAGVMGWHGPEMLIYGILSALFCGLGAFLAQLLDRSIGPRRALILELSLLAIFIFGKVGMGPDLILFVPIDTQTNGIWQTPIFPRLSDLIFLLLSCGSASVLVGSAASSRTMLVYLTPRSEAGAVFGLAAFSSSATSWLAPLLIGISTGMFQTQQAGFAPLIILLAIGVAILLKVGNASENAA